MSFLANTLLKPAIAALLRQYNLDRIGSVTAVELDNGRGQLSVALQLDGENTPIERKRYAKPPLTSADFLSPFTPPRQSAAPALQPKLRASVPQSSSSWPQGDA